MDVILGLALVGFAANLALRLWLYRVRATRRALERLRPKTGPEVPVHRLGH